MDRNYYYEQQEICVNQQELVEIKNEAYSAAIQRAEEKYCGDGSEYITPEMVIDWTNCTF